MATKNLVTQGELGATISSLYSLANNLNEHVNQSLSKAHGWSLIDSAYLDAGGDYETDFGQESTSVIPGLYSTGVNSNGTLANLGSVDSHWSLILSASPKYAGPQAYIGTPLPHGGGLGGYSTNGPLSQWICPSPNASQTIHAGTYKYRITFDLTGFNPSSAVIKGGFVCDNTCSAVLLNGVATGIKGPNSSWPKQPSNGTPILITSGFQAGLNTLDFLIVQDAGDVSNPTGLRVELAGLASAGGVIPIPGIFNTGLNNDGSLVAARLPDPHWVLYTSPWPGNPGPVAYVESPINASYSANTSVSKWISPAKSGDSNVSPGSYTYRLTFDLTGFNPNTAILKGSWVSDNATTGVLINGIDTGFRNALPGSALLSDMQKLTTFLISSGFQTGINTLDFVVKNPSSSPCAIRVIISGAASPSGTKFTPRVLRLNIGGNVFYVPCQVSGGIDAQPDATIAPYTGIISPQSADPASDLTVGSPTPAQLVTSFASVLDAIAASASDTLLNHAGDSAENVHTGLSWQNQAVVNSAGYIAGRVTVNFTLNGVQYRLMGDTNPGGPGSK